ncbi:glycoside hydrolase family 125 protein [Leifsonia poae]|uniref:Glycosyl hydrolase n=1 Tax=Leifsonia poae TaxID=110933 RepID=A0A9W6H8I7_9MICO|nr:glycoside hydrolase family 125 protein [Leifsonia poae]GLJ75312.1 glycosyl hydrolase [Leifsonia poae]
MRHVRAETVDRVTREVRERIGPAVAEVFERCFVDTLESAVGTAPDGTAFVVTGDIPAMWLRDSTAQLAPYLHFLADDDLLADTVAAVSRRQLACILLDPYANAFNRFDNGNGHSDDLTEQSGWVWERKYEIDSLCYPLQLAHDLWRATGRTDHLGEFAAALTAAIRVIRTEQDHEAASPYRFQRTDCPPSDTLVRDGRGSLVAPNGLSWSAFRPSDDACELGYNIPGNAFAVVALTMAAELARDVLDEPGLAAEAEELAERIDDAIRSEAIVTDATGRAILAYEIDGLGADVRMDDSNVPSLLSLPIVGWCAADDPLYLATRAFVLSDQNPYFARGTAATGLGSPHTPPDTIWPIGLAIQGLTALTTDEKRDVLDTLLRTDAGTGFMHESFHKDDPTVFTREWFSWANAMFCELVLDVAGLRTLIRQPQPVGADR